jgi:hypothetical protein
MAYTKPDQIPFAGNLAPDEFVVTLDSGQSVAVRAEGSVEPTSGNPVCAAWARVVNGDGTNAVDAAGQPMETAFCHTSNPTELAELGGAAVLQKIMLMAVLGESTAPFWQDPIHASVLQNASIRTNIASAAHAGPVTDLSSLL